MNTGLSELGMTDVASRPSRGRLWRLALGSLFIVILYVALRNYLYVRAGMLKPDFAIIHKAYNFNLGELPWTLLLIGAFFSGLAATWSGIRKGLLWIAVLYVFIAVDLFALRYYVTYVEPQKLVVKRVRIETPKLSQPIRLLHISDIQAAAITDYEEKIFKTIAALDPDLIINTGDFLQVVPPATFEGELPKLLSLIREANPKFGTFGVFGDTELEFYRLSAKRLEPLEMLSSRSVTIDTGAGVISLHGLSLYQSKNQDWALRTIEQWLVNSESSAFRILFGHSPNFALPVQHHPIDLCLAGHTHGGQVRLPWYGPLVIDSEVPREWSSGFRRIGIPYLNVSAGAGSNRYEGLPPIRFNCPTEMTLIELVPMRPIH